MQTLATCQKSAQTCGTRREWQVRDPAAYQYARRHGWLEDCCAHMSRGPAGLEFSAYLCLFNDGATYVGITRDLPARFRAHLHRGPIAEHAKQAGEPRLTVLASGLEAAQAAAMERQLIAALKPALNTAPGGNTGPFVYRYTLDDCLAVAKKYRYRRAWQNSPLDRHLYLVASHRGWLAQCCRHMELKAKPWTLAECQAEAKKWPTRTAWKHGHHRTWKYACKHGWLAACPPKPLNLAALAARYPTRTALKQHCRRAWRLAVETGQLDALWPLSRATLLGCQASALKFSTRGAWQRGDPQGYGAAKLHRWLDRCCQHMAPAQRTLTFEAVAASAAKSQSRAAWKQADQSAHNKAIRAGWMGQIQFAPARKQPQDVPVAAMQLMRVSA